MNDLYDAVREFAALMGWDDAFDTDLPAGEVRVAGSVAVGSQVCHLAVVASERHEGIHVLLHLPFAVAAGCESEACRLANALNVRLRFGHLEVTEDGIIRFVNTMPTAGCQPGPEAIHHMVLAGYTALTCHMPDLMRVAVAGDPAESLIARWGALPADHPAEPPPAVAAAIASVLLH